MAEGETEQINRTSAVGSRRSSARSSRSNESRRSGQRSGYDYAIRPFGFHNKTNFIATDNLIVRRSDSYTLRKPPPDDDIWKRPPPDFRPQVWRPKPPKRNTQDSMMPWKYGTFPGDYKNKFVKPKPQVLPFLLQEPRSASPEFATRFRVPDPYEAKLMFVKSGVHPRGSYVMPKPHDFRGYPPISSLGLPDFEVFGEHDPYNLKFKSENLDIIYGLKQPPDPRSMGKQMGEPPLKGKPRYEPDLIMPRDKWPTKSGAFTRYRRMHRSPHSALMEHIEDRLSRKWAKEREARDRIERELEEERKQLKEQELLAKELEAATSSMAN
ncbi:putative uncharacterized protein C7orf78 [Ptychodera flava]|uniref:putative uncharacterized protein C7orf78 n=1 Tax=Ptychodera flava TaxID=63121 RepID=UPI00396A1E44